jgi:hypothetical protein
MRFLGGSFGIALSATVFAAFGGFSTPEALTAGFTAAIGVSALLSFGGALAGVCVPGRRRTSA